MSVLRCPCGGYPHAITGKLKAFRGINTAARFYRFQCRYHKNKPLNGPWAFTEDTALEVWNEMVASRTLTI